MINKELRIGVIGVGAIGTEHIKRINHKIKGARVVGIYDILEEEKKKLADEMGIIFYGSGEDLISSDDVDAILITSIDETHADYVLKALAQEKYVFCEKPLAIDNQSCAKIVEAEVKCGRRLVQVGFMRRYDKGYMELKKLIESKSYGEVLMLHCAHRNPESGLHYTTPMSIIQTAVHEIDVLRWLLQDDYVSVESILPKKQTKMTHDNLHDPQILVLETKNGVVIQLEIFVNCQFGYDIKCEVVCENGELGLVDPHYTYVKHNFSNQTPISPDWQTRFKEAYDTEFQLWVNGVLNNKLEGPSSWDGYVASIITTAGTESTNKGEKINVMLQEKPSIY